MAFYYVIQVQVADAEYWRLVGELWTDTEFPEQVRDLWIELFYSARAQREHLMQPEELARYQALEPVIELYRGAPPYRARGLAWTTNIEIAASFARRPGNKESQAR